MYNLAQKPIELPVLDVSKYEFSMEAQKKTGSILYFRKALNGKADEENQVVKGGLYAKKEIATGESG